MPMVPHQKGIFKWQISLTATNLSMTSDGRERKVVAVTKYYILYKAAFVAIKKALLFYYSFQQFTLRVSN